MAIFLKSYRVIFAGISWCLTLSALAAFMILPFERTGFAGEQDDPFPLYPGITRNVAFWKKIYTEYTTRQGVVHDSRNVDIIYEVITLEDWRDPDGYSLNNAKVARSKRHYEHLLSDLKTDHAPNSLEEKRVLSLFSDNNARGMLRDAHLNVRFQLGQKDRFYAGLIRSGAYIDEIRKILRAYDLPEDLAYLPHVESSFNYQAWSKCGAAGIWQFTSGTGRRYMTINYLLDERRDPIISTHAAARFLKENYRMLDDWPSALTAYNHGPGGMLKAQKYFGDYESIFKYYDGPSFGFASRNFYSEFLAAREIARDYRAYFGDIEIDQPIRRCVITLPGYVAIKDLADHFDVDMDTLKQLNPALEPAVFSGRELLPKGCRLNLPEKTAAYTEVMAEDIPVCLFKTPRKTSRYCRVKRGDTANKIAAKYGVRLRDLIHANGLNSRATVYLGQNLVIPGRGKEI